MNRRRAAVSAVLVCSVLTLASCTSTTNGVGTAGAGTSASSAPSTDAGSAGSTGSTAANAQTSTAQTSAAQTSQGSHPATTHPVPSQPLRTATVPSAHGTYNVKIWAEVDNATCVDHAYGQAMITFLTQHPCRHLHRVLGTTFVQGRAVGFAISSTGFNGTPTDPYRWTYQFTVLEHQNGTGSLNDLLREGYRLPSGPTSVPSGEAFNALNQDNGVSVFDVWYLSGPTPNNDHALINFTQDIYLQF